MSLASNKELLSLSLEKAFCLEVIVYCHYGLEVLFLTRKENTSIENSNIMNGLCALVQ